MVEAGKYRVRVQPRASRERVERQPDGTLKVYVTAPPVEGKANKAVVRLLADYWECPKSRIRIIHGQGARDKLVEVLPG